MLSKKLKPYLEILTLAGPIALGMLNSALMQFTDRAYLAHASMSYLEAVLPASTLCWIVLSFFQSLVAYAGVFVSQYHGAGDLVRRAASVRAGALLAVLSGVSVLAFVPAGNAILDFTAPSEEIAALERAYYDICTAGGIFMFVQMAATSYFTGTGRPRLVFWANVVGNTLNVALDPILIFGWFGCPALGVAGAAYATVFSMAVQAAWLALAAHREIRRDLAAAPASASLSSGEFRALVLRLLRFGMPAGGYSVLNMLSFTVFVFVTGRTDHLSFAVSNACFTVNYLVYAPMEGFALGAQTLVGQARGRGDDEAAVMAVRRSLILAVGIFTVVVAALFAFRDPILRLFAPPDLVMSAAFLDLGATLFALMGAWLLFDSVDTILCGALKGAGDTRFVMAWMLFSAFGVWLPLVGVVALVHFTMPWLWSTTVVYVLVLFVGTWIRWKRGSWRAIHLVKTQAPVVSA